MNSINFNQSKKKNKKKPSQKTMINSDRNVKKEVEINEKL